LLLLNGLGAHMDMWQPFVDHVGVRTVIGLDLPGTGGSRPAVVPQTMWQLAALVHAFVRRLECGRVDVLGMSWGGLLAQALAITRPRTVRRLVLAVTNPGVGGVPGPPRVLAAMLTPWRYYSLAHLRAVGPSLYGGRARHDPADFERAAAARMASPPSPVGYAMQVFATGTYSGIPWLRCLRARTLVVAGDDDPVVPLVNAHLLASLIPDATLHVVPGGGHLLLLDSAPAVAPMVARFLDAPPAG
jgi:pimeloyl-ACP methyl ester carboxylesterase